MNVFIAQCQYCPSTLPMPAVDYPFREDEIEVQDEGWDSDGFGGYTCCKCLTKNRTNHEQVYAQINDR